MNRRGEIFDLLWLLFCACASTVWCWTAANQLGATFDEPTYIRYGLDRWNSGSYRELMRKGAMPFAVDVQTLPIHVWEKAHGSKMPFPARLRWARTASFVFWWGLLVYTLRAGRLIGGNWGGRIAVALLACEPIVVGHAGLATADIAVSAWLLALSVEFEL